eukprot:gene5444-10933_t
MRNFPENIDKISWVWSPEAYVPKVLCIKAKGHRNYPVESPLLQLCSKYLDNNLMIILLESELKISSKLSCRYCGCNQIWRASLNKPSKKIKIWVEKHSKYSEPKLLRLCVFENKGDLWCIKTKLWKKSDKCFEKLKVKLMLPNWMQSENLIGGFSHNCKRTTRKDSAEITAETTTLTSNLESITAPKVVSAIVKTGNAALLTSQDAIDLIEIQDHYFHSLDYKMIFKALPILLLSYNSGNIIWSILYSGYKFNLLAYQTNASREFCKQKVIVTMGAFSHIQHASQPKLHYQKSRSIGKKIDFLLSSSAFSNPIINKMSTILTETTSVILLMNIEAFTAFGSIPRNPENKHLCTPIAQVDRDSSLIIYISHVWLRGQNPKGNVTEDSHPDDFHNSKYKLIIDGVEQLFKSFGNDMDKCYIWLDYSCINQDINPANELHHLDEIMRNIDCIFTPILYHDTNMWSYPPSMSNWYEEFKCPSWYDSKSGYINRSWCRLEMLYALFIPTFNNSNRINKFSGILKLFASNYSRPHFIYTNIENIQSESPIILPLLDISYIESLDPLQGHLSKESDRIKINELRILLESYIKIAKDGGYTGNIDITARKRSNSGVVNYSPNNSDNCHNNNNNSTRPRATSVNNCPIRSSSCSNNKSSRSNKIKSKLSPRNELTVIDKKENKCINLQITPVRYDDNNNNNDNSNNNNCELYSYNIKYNDNNNKNSDNDTNNLSEIRNAEETTHNTGVIFNLNLSNGSTYEGPIENDLAHGYGIQKYQNGDIYEGYWLEGKKNGKGIKYFICGDLYDGEWKDDHIHGTGTYKFKNGDIHHSNFKNGIFHGRRIVKYANGNIYEGDFLGDMLHGKGIFQYINGNIYEGDFYNDKISGKGIVTYVNGNIYNGDWIDGIRTGKGKVHYANGDIYEGEYRNDRKHGIGKYISEDAIYEGNFIDGKISGKGLVTYTNGNIYKGDWLDDMMTGKGIYKYINGDIYDGEFLCNKREGYGVLKYSNGNSYMGPWKEDQMHGKGFFRYSNGNTYEGNWLYGEDLNQNDAFAHRTEDNICSIEQPEDFMMIDDEIRGPYRKYDYGFQGESKWYVSHSRKSNTARARSREFQCIGMRVRKSFDVDYTISVFFLVNSQYIVIRMSIHKSAESTFLNIHAVFVVTPFRYPQCELNHIYCYCCQSYWSAIFVCTYAVLPVTALFFNILYMFITSPDVVWIEMNGSQDVTPMLCTWPAHVYHAVYTQDFKFMDHKLLWPGPKLSTTFSRDRFSHNGVLSDNGYFKQFHVTCKSNCLQQQILSPDNIDTLMGKTSISCEQCYLFDALSDNKSIDHYRTQQQTFFFAILLLPLHCDQPSLATHSTDKTQPQTPNTLRGKSTTRSTQHFVRGRYYLQSKPQHPNIAHQKFQTSLSNTHMPPSLPFN